MQTLLDRNLAQHPTVVETLVGGEAVMLHLEDDSYFGLDIIGTEIWYAIANDLALRETCMRLAEKCGQTKQRVELDVQSLLEDLLDANLIVFADENSS